MLGAEEMGGVMAMEPVDILSNPPIGSIRRQIREILNSYSHPWDALAELCQNSVDAINQHADAHGPDARSHTIEVTIDRRTRTLSVRDTGIGIEPESLAALLAPYSTSKDDDESTIGEKGVGLTYTMFVSNKYQIETVSCEGHAAGDFLGGSDWVTRVTDVVPRFQPTTFEEAAQAPTQTFTQVSLTGVSQDPSEPEDLFAISDQHLVFWLRTRTACGYAGTLFGRAPKVNVKIALTVVGTDGTSEVLDVPYAHLNPEEFVAQSKIEDYARFDEWFLAERPSEAQQRQRLRNKVLVRRGTISQSGREVRFFAFYSPSKDFWRDASESAQLQRTDEDGNTINLLRGGVYVAHKGMPTGLELPPLENVGLGTYYGNMFIVIEDDKLKFDIGRKWPRGGVQGILKKLVHQHIFLPFRQPFFALMSTPPTLKPKAVRDAERDALFHQLETAAAKIDVDGINVRRHPDSQEAHVVALFHELVAAGYLPQYYTYLIGYKQQYDFYGKFVPGRESSRSDVCRGSGLEHRLVAEFKYLAESLLDDIDNETKFFTDISLLVCWDFNEPKLAAKGVQVVPLGVGESPYAGVTHRLVGNLFYGADATIDLIALRHLTTLLSRP